LSLSLGRQDPNACWRPCELGYQDACHGKI
jgi:hypothetical protein